MNTGSGLSVAITQQATRDTAGAGSIITASVAAGSDAGGVVGGGGGGVGVGIMVCEKVVGV